MRLEIVGKNGFVPSDALKKYAEQKLAKISSSFKEGVVPEARVVFKVYNDHHKVEVTIPAKNLILRAEVNDLDMYAAVDRVVDKLMVQIRKHKDRVKSKLEKEGIKDVFSREFVDIESLEKEVLASQLVKNKEVKLEPMDVNDALAQMELLGHNFFVFLNKASKRVCVAYLREDGDYAVIETN